jgi:hypothetical protein
MVPLILKNPSGTTVKEIQPVVKLNKILFFYGHIYSFKFKTETEINKFKIIKIYTCLKFLQ